MKGKSLYLQHQLIKSITENLTVSTCCHPVSLPVQKCWLLTGFEKEQLLTGVHYKSRSLEKHSADDERGEN